MFDGKFWLIIGIIVGYRILISKNYSQNHPKRQENNLSQLPSFELGSSNLSEDNKINEEMAMGASGIEPFATTYGFNQNIMAEEISMGEAGIEPFASKYGSRSQHVDNTSGN